jgi:hypothetical protein
MILATGCGLGWGFGTYILVGEFFVGGLELYMANSSNIEGGFLSGLLFAFGCDGGLFEVAT